MLGYHLWILLPWGLKGGYLVPWQPWVAPGQGRLPGEAEQGHVEQEGAGEGPLRTDIFGSLVAGAPGGRRGPAGRAGPSGETGLWRGGWALAAC